MSELKDGLYPGMTRTDYEAIEAINCSRLKHFKKSAAHAREYMLHPAPPSEAMDFGSAFHCAILEPERFQKDYVVAPQVDRRTKAGKDTWSQFEELHRGKELLAADDFDTLKGMRESCMSDKVVSELLSSPGKNEVCAVWTDLVTGLRCKCLIDRITRWAGWTVVLDFKTADNASPPIFSLAIAKYQYHEQAAFYLDGLKTLSDLPRKWLFVAIEKKRPYALACYELGEAELALGKEMFQAHLKQYKSCVETNIWPSYPSGVTTIRLPKWSFVEDVE